MGIIETTRNLGVEIQKDERFIRYIKAKLANDNDETLQNQIGEFNTVRMNLDREMNAETQDEAKIRELNEKLREIYTAVMSSKTMLEYNTAKAEVDAMLNDINSIIMQCVDGEDPMTAEPHTACTGSCSSCSGCH
ncbi:MAG: YlbF family regulator [Clostridia bacterium]|nr:YlbF family regulator [Clostridia bacterium]